MSKAGRSPGSRRRFDYERHLLPSPRLAALEPAEVADEEAARNLTGRSIGYPAWNLLYYSLYCSLLPVRDDFVVIETGTHRGASTIVMAQALKDVGVDAAVDTVEHGQGLAKIAKANIEQAGLNQYVRFHVEDSLTFLSRLADQVDHIDFVLLDDDHRYAHVVEELEILCPKVAARRGKIYFDNTAWGDVALALRDLRRIYGGNLIEFANCSWRPPGNAIWQSD
jgi:predicted O-methyltransferase YrrM